MVTSKVLAVLAASALAIVGVGVAGCRYGPGSDRANPSESRESRGGPARVTVTPEVCVNPVKTQHVFVATVTDAAGNPLSGVDVEWILTRAGQNSVGAIVDVDGGHKIDNTYARSTTGRSSYSVSRGNQEAQDDVRVGPGQTWCAITSGEEGESQMMAYVPSIGDWDRHQAFATKTWMDVGWQIPHDVTTRVGEPQKFAFRAFRYSNHAPIKDYVVTWTQISGPEASINDSGRTFVAKTDESGVSTITVMPKAQGPGVAEIRVDVVRPAGRDECVCWSEALLGSWTVTACWAAPSLSIVKTAPEMETVGCSFQYEIAVTNTSPEIEVRDVVVTDPLPAGVVYESSEPPAEVNGNELRWKMGNMAAGGSCSMRVTVHATKGGTIENCAVVTGEGGLTAKACASTCFTAPKLTITKTGPAQAAVCDAATYQIVVCNTGDSPATNVHVVDQLPPGLTTQDPCEWNVGTLAAGETRTFTLCTESSQAGALTNTATVTADGLSARAAITTQFVACQLAITKTAPETRYFGRPLPYRITVTNTGPVDATNVIVEDTLQGGLTFQGASDGGACSSTGNTVSWRLGTIAKGQSKTITVDTVVSATQDGTITNTATAHGDCCAAVTATCSTRISGRAGILLECIDVDDPIEVDGTETYVIEVINQGNAVDHNVVIRCMLPAEEEFVSAEGPDGLAAQVNGKDIVFAPIQDLAPATNAPNNRKTYRICVKAVGKGDVRFRTELTSAQLTSPVVETESTHIY